MTRLPATTDSPAIARRLVSSELVDCDPQVISDAALMISELVTNAVVHGAGPIEVDLQKAGDAIKATVTDRGAGRPVPKAPGPREPHGRGLLIVRSLAHDWGVIEVGDAKSVWFTLRCRQPDSAPI